MATLEKIRSKSVLLFVIIIVALLAFILGDFLTSGQTYFGSGTTVASAAGEKVDYIAYQNRVNQESEAARQQGNNNIDNDELQQSVISELLFEQLLDKEYRQLGIVVTDKEITQALTGEVPYQGAMQFIATVSQQLGLPAASGAAVYDAMMNPAKYGLSPEVGTQLKQMWAAQEKDVETALLQQKFYQLLSGLFTASEVDAKAMYNDNAATRHIAYVAKEYNMVPDDEIEVSDADLKAVWESEKQNYRLNEETRAVDYIMVPVEPSQADRLAGQQEVENALMELNNGESLEKIQSNIRFVVNRVSNPASRITDNRLKQFVDTAVNGQAAIVSHVGDTYRMAQLIGKEMKVDSINLTMVGRADQGSLDSVLVRLNNGEALSAVVDGTTVQSNDSTWFTLGGAGADAKAVAALTAATIGKPFIHRDTINGTPVEVLYIVNKRHAPVTFYDVATIDYTIDPSTETLTDISTKLNTFVANNSSAADFAANAAEAGYSVLPAQVGASSPHIARVADSRQAVKWVMEAKKGQVMPVYQDSKQSYMLTVAVRDIYDGEYLPYDAVSLRTTLTGRARNLKKGDKLMEQYAGKASDLAGYAKLMGVEVAESDVNFSSPMLATLGFNESTLQGSIAAAETGKLTGPIKGNNAIMVFEVKNVDTESRPYVYDDYARTFNSQLGIFRFNPMQILLGKEKVVNNSLNFVQSAVE